MNNRARARTRHVLTDTVEGYMHDMGSAQLNPFPAHVQIPLHELNKQRLSKEGAWMDHQLKSVTALPCVSGWRGCLPTPTPTPLATAIIFRFHFSLRDRDGEDEEPTRHGALHGSRTSPCPSPRRLQRFFLPCDVQSDRARCRTRWPRGRRSLRLRQLASVPGAILLAGQQPARASAADEGQCAPSLAREKRNDHSNSAVHFLLITTIIFQRASDRSLELPLRSLWCVRYRDLQQVTARLHCVAGVLLGRPCDLRA